MPFMPLFVALAAAPLLASLPTLSPPPPASLPTTLPASLPATLPAPPLLGAFGVEPPSPPAPSDGSESPLPPRGLDPNRTELGLVPIVGGDTDIGIGGGALGSLAKFDELHNPYRYRFELTGLITFRPTGAALEIPFQDYNLQWVIPDLWRSRVRLRFKVAFTHFSTMPYYGLGNASEVDQKWQRIDARAHPQEYMAARQYYQYDRYTPWALAEARLTLSDRLFTRLTGWYNHNWINVRPGSKLAQDLARGDSKTAALLRGGGGSYGVAQLEGGVTYDSRDDETAPKRGSWHELSARVAPPLAPARLFFGGATLTLRTFFSIYRHFLVLALRAMADLIFGDAPFYEIGLYDAGNAVGGGTAIRGVPLLRYYAKVKLLGNIEARFVFYQFMFFKQNFRIGAVAFFDGGRNFADYRYDPALDGRGLGLKWGAGGGVRLQWGETFVLRGDIAWSPDAMPLGMYFNVGQTF